MDEKINDLTDAVILTNEAIIRLLNFYLDYADIEEEFSELKEVRKFINSSNAFLDSVIHREN